MSRYIVTGGSGRLGRSVVATLAEAGHEVISVDKQSNDDVSARQVQHDLKDGRATAELFAELRPDAVVHLAAISVPFSAPDPFIYETNTSIAYSVIEASVSSGAKSVLAASSPTVIGYGARAGWRPRYLPLDEEHPLEPWNGYALSKQAIEQMIAMAVRQSGDTVRFGVFRPCFVISPEEWAGAVTQQGHTVRDRLDDPALSAVALFNYLDARDAGTFVLAWLERADRIPNGSCFFVAAGDSLAEGSVVDLLPRFVPGTEEFVGSLASESPVFSSELARRLLDWVPQHSWRTELAPMIPPYDELGVSVG